MPTDTRDKILQAAFTVLSRQGYENASIKEIAEAAGVAQGLVHYYFKSKQQLVVAVLFSVCEKMDVYAGEGEAGALAAFENFKALLRTRGDVHTLYIQLIGVGLHGDHVGGEREAARAMFAADPADRADAAFMIELTSSTVVSRAAMNDRSTTETLIVGTRIA